MKTITKTLIILVCLLSVNLSMASTPEKDTIEKEKNEVINKICRSVSHTSFSKYAKCRVLNQIVLRCEVNDSCRVVVCNIIGVNEDLKKAILTKMARRSIRTSEALCGQELALRISFKKYDK